MKTNSIPRKKTAPMQPVLVGTKLANARIIIDRRGRVNNYKGHPIMAIDADGMVYEFQSAAAVQRECRISSGAISSAIGDYKKGKKEVPLVQGFCWCYCKDKELLPKIKAWIALNAADNRKTHI
ncbi:MAG: hypothetical protein II825_09380 [Paludibacteraceae bacterium]|nr:hypothetical protein [Paludibacteraceae bacterium]